MGKKLARYQKAVNQYNNLLKKYGETIVPTTQEQLQLATVLDDIDNSDVQQFVTSLQEFGGLLPEQPHSFLDKLRLKRAYTETVEARITEQLNIAENMWSRITFQATGGLCTLPAQQVFNTTVNTKIESGKTYENHYFYMNIPSKEYLQEQEKENHKKLESTSTRDVKKIEYNNIDYRNIEHSIQEYGYTTFAVYMKSVVRTTWYSLEQFRFIADKLYRELEILNKQAHEKLNNNYFTVNEIVFIQDTGFVFIITIKNPHDFSKSKQSEFKDRCESFMGLVNDCVNHMKPVESFFVEKLKFINETYLTGLPVDEDLEFKHRKLKPFVNDALENSFTAKLPVFFRAETVEKKNNDELSHMKLYSYDGKLDSYYSIYQNIIAGETMFGVGKQLILTSSPKVYSAMINEIYQTLYGAKKIMNEHLPGNEFFTVEKLVASYYKGTITTVFTVKNHHLFKTAPFLETLFAFNTLLVEHNKFTDIIKKHLQMIAWNTPTPPLSFTTPPQCIMKSPNLTDINNL